MRAQPLSVAAVFVAIASMAVPLETRAVVVSGNTNATALASAIAGTGVSISNATFTTDVIGDIPSGTFAAGGNIGFDSGIVLTTGTIGCVAGPNSSSSCSGQGTLGDPNFTTNSYSSLKFSFQSSTGSIFFNYVFASEEYNEFVGSNFNDQFELRLNGTNIALLANSGGVVSINNVNCSTNSAYYRNNTTAVTGCASQGINTQYDGLTTVLTASATVGAGANTFEFRVFDRGDNQLDSAVFIQAGSFTGVVPEPGTFQLQASGMLFLSGAIYFRRRARREASAPKLVAA